MTNLTVTYVKLYLVKNRKCLAKAKTLLSNKRTLDPFFHQQLTFHEDYHGCILQVSIHFTSAHFYVTLGKVAKLITTAYPKCNNNYRSEHHLGQLREDG